MMSSTTSMTTLRLVPKRFWTAAAMTTANRGILPSTTTLSYDYGHRHRHRHHRRQQQKQHQRCMSTDATSAATTHVLMETLAHEQDPACTITKITLNRPKVNAMGREMMIGFSNILTQLETIQQNSLESRTRCVVLTSSSPKIFSAGADLKERELMKSLEEVEDFVTMLRNTMQRVSELPVPVVAAIEGAALGGGLELALAADLRIAGANATLGAPETRLAIVPGAGGTQRLPRLVGVARAKELIWTGRKVGADEAVRYGMVEEVVEAGQATDRAVELAFQIASQAGPVAIRFAKEAIDRGMEERHMKDALEVERQSDAKVLSTRDRLEGLASFKEGRPPRYRGH